MLGDTARKLSASLKGFKLCKIVHNCKIITYTLNVINSCQRRTANSERRTANAEGRRPNAKKIDESILKPMVAMPLSTDRRQMKMKRALITGITGQDGSYLADFLLKKDYEVHGIIRRASTFNTARIDHLYQDPHVNGVRLFLHYGDLSDSVNLVKLLYDLRPDEIYHLGAQSHVRVGFDIPEYTADVTGIGTIRILEAIRETGVKTRFYQASSSECSEKSGRHLRPKRRRFRPGSSAADKEAQQEEY